MNRITTRTQDPPDFSVQRCKVGNVLENIGGIHNVESCIIKGDSAAVVIGDFTKPFMDIVG